MTSRIFEVLLFTVSVFMLYVVYIFENYTCFTARSYTFLKRFYKALFLGPFTLVFSPLQVLVAELLCRQGFLVNLGIENYFRWYNSHSTFIVLYLCSDTTCELRSFPLTCALLHLGTFRFKFIHIVYLTTLYGFVTIRVSANTTRFGVQVDILGRGVSNKLKIIS